MVIELPDIAEAAAVVYDDWGVCRRWATEKGFTRFQSFDEGDAQAMLCINDAFMVLAIRGTEFKNWADWKADLRVGKEWSPYGRVHGGFKDYLGRIWDDILLAVSKARDKQTVIVCGHSMGGAMATLATMYLKNTGNSPHYLLTFGSPRVGDAEFARNMHAARFGLRHKRFVNNNDIVVRFPFWGYRHCGNLEYFDCCGKLESVPSRWKVFRDRLAGRIRDIGEWGTDGIKDHDKWAYVDLVRKNCGSVA